MIILGINRRNTVRNQCPGGQALVEFAFVLPILLLLMVAIIDFGIIFYSQMAVSNAAWEGARAGATIIDPSQGDQEITGAIHNAAYGLDISRLTIDIDPAQDEPPPQSILSSTPRGISYNNGHIQYRTHLSPGHCADLRAGSDPHGVPKPVKNSEKAQVVIIVAVLLMVILLMLALIIDGARLMVEQQELKRAADAAGKAGLIVVGDRMVTQVVSAQTAAANLTLTATPAGSTPGPTLTPTPAPDDFYSWLNDDHRETLVAPPMQTLVATHVLGSVEEKPHC